MPNVQFSCLWTRNRRVSLANRIGCILWALGLAVLIMILGGCSTLPRNPTPVDQLYSAEVPNLPNVRAWAGQPSPAFQTDIQESAAQEPPGLFTQGSDGKRHYSALTISGGGEYGSFAAGVLNGWSSTGERPTFKLVTGISAGALIAPFAFLGADYDEALKNFFTGELSPKAIYVFRGILPGIFGEAFADTSPLADLIAKHVDADFLQAVADAHGQGRRLYIGTAHLDADRLMIWNMGAIARSGDPQALELFRKVMLASASIPGVFPPVYFDVTADGQTYDEMHVDGGVKTQVFLYVAVMDFAKARAALGIESQAKGTVYLIRNGKLIPEPAPVSRNTKDIAQRSVSSMIKAQALGDLYRIFSYTQRENMAFRYVGIPDSHQFEDREEFDPGEMKRLYETGFEVGQSADPWLSVPPGYQARADDSKG